MKNIFQIKITIWYNIFFLHTPTNSLEETVMVQITKSKRVATQWICSSFWTNFKTLTTNTQDRDKKKQNWRWIEQKECIVKKLYQYIHDRDIQLVMSDYKKWMVSPLHRVQKIACSSNKGWQNTKIGKKWYNRQQPANQRRQITTILKGSAKS